MLEYCKACGDSLCPVCGKHHAHNPILSRCANNVNFLGPEKHELFKLYVEHWLDSHPAQEG